MKNKVDYTIFSPTAVPEQAFTAAVTDIITSAAHGLSERDCIQLTTATTLPAGLSLATNYYLINVTTNTFKLSATPGGTAVNITDTGTGTHTYHLKGKAIFVGDFTNKNLHLTFSSTPTMTVKFQGSLELEAPDFNADQSATNKWDYIDVTDLEDEASIDGDTGVACTGTADNRMFRITGGGVQWVCAVLSAFTTGLIGVTVSLSD